MKKTLLVTTLATTLGVTSPSASAITALTNGDYWLEITGGCFDFGNCQTNGRGKLVDNTTARQASAVGFGSGIVGDGIMGKIGFTLADGDISVTSYSQDSYLDNSFVTLYIQDQGATGNGGDMGLTIDNSTGAVTFDPTGRDAIGANTAESIGLQEWNRDDSDDGLGSGLYTQFTTGTSTNRRVSFGTPFTLTGSELVDAGPNMWTGTIVSAGNFGQAWGDFNRVAYAEVWDIKVTKHVVPIPAAVWLFGSGLLGLISVVRRRKVT